MATMRPPADGVVDIVPLPVTDAARPHADGQRLAIPSIASTAAAVLHAAAAGIHADHPQLARVFVALAVAQGAAAILGFVRADRRAAWLVVWVNLVAVAGWIVTRLSGVAWIEGLEVAERPQLADSISATFAAVAVVGAVAAWSPHARAVPSRAVTNAAILAGILVVPGLADATSHDHVGVDPHNHDGQAIAVDAEHSHDGEAAAVDGAPSTGSEPTDGSGISSGGDIDAALGGLVGDGRVDTEAGLEGSTTDVTTRPYDPTQPIDLGGVPGVSAEQQAFAENLVAATVRDLGQWSDLDVVDAAGFHSIGDAATGHEHYIQWDWIDDDVWLDPDFPESLVFEPRADGTKQLVSAMYMLPTGTSLDDIPDWGGALMQWHVHGDLCFVDDPIAPTVAGTKPIGTQCRPPLVDPAIGPMIHVWITSTPCGPFAALEGIAGGQVREGEAVLCDHAHGV